MRNLEAIFIYALLTAYYTAMCCITLRLPCIIMPHCRCTGVKRTLPSAYYTCAVVQQDVRYWPTMCNYPELCAIDAGLDVDATA